MESSGALAQVMLNIPAGAKNQTQEKLNQTFASTTSLDFKQGWRFSLVRQLYVFLSFFERQLLQNWKD